MSRNLSALLCLLSAILVFFPDAARAAPEREQAIVRDVVDGDTLRIIYGGERRLVRLIGIDTPESEPNEKAAKQVQRTGVDLDTILNLGRRAKSAVKAIVRRDTVVTLEFDVEHTDYYGRLLAYVYLPDGSMLNERIIRLGYAHLLTWPPNVRYAERLKSAFEEARTTKRGLWSMEGFEASDPPRKSKKREKIRW